jgi:hypothetical protein
MLHLFDMAGSLTHFWFVLAYVAPFERIVAAPEPVPLPVLAAEHA